MDRPQDDRLALCRLWDVPPWLLGFSPRPRLARLRWMLRRFWRI